VGVATHTPRPSLDEDIEIVPLRQGTVETAATSGVITAVSPWVMNGRIYFDGKKKDLPHVLPAPTIADMNTPPELHEQLRESREENRGFRARLDLIAEIITCQDEEEEDEDEDPKEEGDEKEEEEGEEDSEEGDVDKYYLG
jgi:hypothetical protein